MDLLVSCHGLSLVRHGFTHRFPISFLPKQQTSASVFQSTNSLDYCLGGTDCYVSGKTWSRDNGIHSSDAGTANQTTLSPKLQKLQVHPVPEPTQLKQPSCMLKSSILRSQVVFHKETGKGENPHVTLVARWSPSENSLYM